MFINIELLGFIKQIEKDLEAEIKEDKELGLSLNSYGSGFNRGGLDVIKQIREIIHKEKLFGDEWQFIRTDDIPNNTKFVVLYSDGSGSKLLHKDKSGKYWDCDKEEVHEEWLRESCLYWSELPDNFKLWKGEINAK